MALSADTRSKTYLGHLGGFEEVEVLEVGGGGGLGQDHAGIADERGAGF